MQKISSRDKLLNVTFETVYRYGYHSASTAEILKGAGVPKGSMYHHFGSKKGMILAMIEERLIPKVRAFFDFEMRVDTTAIEVLEHTMQKVAHNTMLIQHGCPLHRLMFEMGALDNEIAQACEVEFVNLTNNLAKVLAVGVREGSIIETDTSELAGYIITSSWGFLSRPMASSSKEQFLRDSGRLLESIQP